MNTSSRLFPNTWLTLFFLLLAVPRITAATVTWDGGGDGVSWHDAANWSGDTIPDATDAVTISLAGAEVKLTSGNVVVQSLSCPRTLTLLGGRLETANAFFAGGTLELNGGQFSGTALVLNGTLRLSGIASETATFLLRGSCNLHGNVAATQTLAIQGGGQGGHAHTTWLSGWRNAGTMRLETTDGGWESHLRLPSDAPADTFVEVQAGGRLEVVIGSGGRRYVDGRLRNRGTIAVTGGAVLQVTFPTSLQFVQHETGALAADAASAFHLLAGEFHLEGGSVAGRVVAHDADVWIAAAAQGPAPLIATGNSRLRSHTGGPVELLVEGSGEFAHAVLSIPEPVSVAGTIRFQTLNGGWRSELNAAGGLELTAAGRLLVRAGSGGSRTFTGRIINGGLIDVASDTFTRLTGDYTGNGGRTDGPFNLTGCTIQFNETGPAQADEVIVTGDGNELRSSIPPRQTLRLEGGGAFGHAALSVPQAAEVLGTLALVTANGGWSETVSVAADAQLLVREGGRLEALTGSGGARQFDGYLVNQGTVAVEPGVTLALRAGAATRFTQRLGVLTVEPGGTFELQGGRFDWDGGTVQGNAHAVNSAIHVASAVTEPGTLIVSGTSPILEANESPAATLRVQGDGRYAHGVLNVTGTAVNRGTIHLQTGDGGWRSIIVAGETGTLVNEGTVSVAAGSGGERSFTGRFRHLGQIQVAADSDFVITGQFEAAGGQVSGPLYLVNVQFSATASPTAPTSYRLVGGSSQVLTDILPSTTLQVLAGGRWGHAQTSLPLGFVNRGALELLTTDGGWITTLSAPTGGALSNAPNARLTTLPGSGGRRIISAAIHNAGQVEFNTGTELAGGFINAADGELNLIGPLDLGSPVNRAALENSGLLRPGSPLGTTTLRGNFRQLAAGELVLETENQPDGGLDTLRVEGTAALAGKLTLQVPPDYSAPVGTRWLAVDANARTGQFQQIDSLTLGTDLAFNPQYTADDLALEVTARPTDLVPPTILTQPQSAYWPNGASVELRVTVSGSEPRSFQWLRNGAVIPNATNDTHSVTVSAATQGSYQVTVSNAAGSVVSDPATLTLLAGVIPADVAVRPSVPPVPGDGTVIELYNGIGGGLAPKPADLDGLSPSGVTRSPVVDFPHPNAAVGVGGQFEVFFADTTVPPESVRGLPAANFILRTQPFLAVSRALDLNPATPAIEIQLGVGSDDGFDLRIGEAQLGNAGDRGFTYTWMPVAFADEGLYPLSLLFAANAVGASGLEFSWKTALVPAGEIIPQDALYTSPDLGDRLITFEELPAGTVVSNQFANLGVLITTTGGVQATDAKPSRFVPVSPIRVLGDPATEGATPGSAEFRFTGPNGTGTGITDFVSFFVIDAEATGAVVTAFDPDGGELHRSEHHGGGGTQERVMIQKTNVHRVVITLGSGNDTVALDNFSFTAPRAFNRAPQITGPTEVAIAEGQTVNAQFTASDPDAGDTVLFSLVPPFPAGVVLNPQTGALSWPVSEAQGPGNYSLRVRATDSATPPLSADQVLQVTVNEVNQNPTLPPYGPRLVNAGEPFELQLIAFDADLPPQSLTFTLESGPAGAQLTPQGLLTWTPPAGANADFPVNFRVSDSFNPAGTAAGSVILRAVSAPDLQITRLEAPAEGDTGASFNATYRESNLGTAPATGTWVQRLWISRDNRLDDGDTLLGEFPFTGTVNPGQFVERTLQFRFPNVAGSYWLIAAADAANAILEGAEDNNLRLSAVPIVIGAAYTATVATDFTTGLAGTPIVMTGTAHRRGGAPAAFELVNIHVRVRGTTRLLSALTDEQGRFSTTFRPLLGEAGDYTIGAAHPGEATAPVQDNFRLLGMEFAPAELSFDLRALSSVTQHVVLRNRSEAPLNGLTVAVEDLPATVTLNFTPPNSLAGNAEVPLDVELVSTADESLQGTVTLRVLSTEGAVATLRLNLQTRSLAPVLAAEPGSLVTSMLRGDQTVVNFTLRNNGGRPTGPLNVLLPALPWMASATTSPLPPLAPGETANISLLLTPAADLPLAVYPGTLVVSDGAAFVNVPYRFACVSDALASLRVEAVDEFTYYAEGSPRVIGARVEVRDQLTGNAVTNGVTGADGTITFNGLREGYYEVLANATDHNESRETVLVTAGPLNEHQAFLVRHTVKYYFTVEEVDLEERTKVVIESVFETVVPAPVVTVEPNFIDLNAITQDRVEIELKITNHGLIAAKAAELDFGSSSRFRFTPLQTELGDLPARSSLTVPLVIERIGAAQPAASSDRVIRINRQSAGGDCPSARLLYELVCGTRTNTYSVGVGLAGTGCGGGGFVFGGGGGGGGAVSGEAIFFGKSIPCDPCGEKLAGALLECIIGFLPIPDPISCLKDTHGCLSDPSWLACAQALVSCIKAVGKEVPFLGELLSALDCMEKLKNACKKEDGAGGQITRHGTDPTTFPGLNGVIEQERRLRAIVNGYKALIGDDAWFHAGQTAAFTAFVADFSDALAAASDGGQRITEAERAALLAGPLPVGVNAESAGKFLDRWNRSLDYEARGIRDLADVPAGESADFIPRDQFRAAMQAAAEAIALNEAEGFTDPLAAAQAAVDKLRANLADAAGTGGVCARVRLRLDQEAVQTRQGFRATLELVNDSGEPLDGVLVNLEVRDEAGALANGRFGIPAPELTNLSDVGGTGTVAPATTGRAAWTIIPGPEAAPSPNPARYFIGGEFSYVQQGTRVRIPLTPVGIDVHPTPQLALAYFHERDVRSDDPFTPEIEPSIPYSLAVLVKNSGFGAARNLRITSSQPKIIENDKGLLINFDLIATQVGTESLTPSLTADFGDVPPGGTRQGRWLFKSSLQGQFIEYSATFEHLGVFSQFPELASIQSVEIHELIHIVRATGAGDDGLPDFLVNDIADDDYLPDTLHFSQGGTNPVSVVRQATFDGAPTTGDLEASFTANAPAGWVYFRLPDFGNGDFRVTRVLRADGSEVSFGDNVWTTDRTFVAGGRRPKYEFSLHIFDRLAAAGPVTYRVIYNPPPTGDTTAPGSVVAPLPGSSGPQIPVQWAGDDNAGGSGLGFFDVFVSVDGGAFAPWQQGVTTRGGIYPGEPGKTYAFYTVAVDNAGNREAAPATPDTVTTVNRSNAPPELTVPATLTVEEGTVAAFVATATDPDAPADVLTFSLGADAPPGAVINARTGAFSWPTGEGTGPVTNRLTVTVTDNGIPPLADSATVEVVVREVNRAPVIAPLADVVVNEGSPLVIPVTAVDDDLPAQALTYRLGAPGPTGMAISAAGVITWTPNEFQGPNTNRVEVFASDGVVESFTSFRVIVRDVRPDFTITAGRTHLFAGRSGLLSIVVEAGVDLTANFRLDLLNPATAAGFSGLTFTPGAGLFSAASLTPAGPFSYEAQLTLAPGAAANGPQTALLAFDVAADAPSGRVRINLHDATGTFGDTVLTRPRLADGRVIVINREPVLELNSNSGLRLGVYGRAGVTYLLEHRPSLAPNASWQLRDQILINESGLSEEELIPADGVEGLFLRVREP